MSLELLQERRDATCALLRAVGPAAPTLCAGWSTGDLAFHLWTLDHAVIPALAASIGLGQAVRGRLRALRSRFTFEELLEELEDGDGSFRCMPEDCLTGYGHAIGEWFIHGEDVRRANGLPAEPISAELDQALWRRLRVAAPQLHPLRRFELVRPDGKTARTGLGALQARVHGETAELMLWAYGRREAAEVTLERPQSAGTTRTATP